MAAFLGGPVPVFEIRNVTKDGEMLIRNNELGHALAQTLGKGPAALLRGHGAVVVADSLHVVVGRAYYMNVNARELLQALQVPGAKSRTSSPTKPLPWPRRTVTNAPGHYGSSKYADYPWTRYINQLPATTLAMQQTNK